MLWLVSASLTVCSRVTWQPEQLRFQDSAQICKQWKGCYFKDGGTWQEVVFICLSE